jgi:hypothetical protein
MSIEAIAALLGHESLDMTRQYAGISNRVVADEYAAVTAKVEAPYTTTTLPASAEGPNMRRLRAEVNHRLLGNGLCTRPAELNCSSNPSAKAAATSPPTKLAAFRSLLTSSNDARVFLIPATRKPKLAARQTVNIAVTPNGFGSSVRIRYCLRASGKRPGTLKVDVFQDGVLFETGTKAAAKTGTDYAFSTGVGVSEGTVTVRISIYSDRSPMILDNLYVQLDRPQMPG